MKRNLLVLIVTAFAAWTALPGCGTNSEKQPALQAPENAQSEAPAEGATAMPSDTATQRENPAGAAETKKTGEDSDDDDDDRK